VDDAHAKEFAMEKSPRERAVDRQVGIVSIALAPFALLIILLWLMMMYTIAVHVFPHALGIDWPDPLALIPPGWRRALFWAPRT
jgi:hypothetical protein